MYSLTPSDIDRLLQGEPITDEWPWNTGDAATVEKHYKAVLAEVCRKCDVRDRTEWNHYGSGYASYMDCWLYRESDAFRAGSGDDYHGLVVLLSRLSPFYVIGEGKKWWSPNGNASSYLPHADFVDEIRTPAVVQLVEPVTAVLRSRRLVRLRKSELSDPLPSKTHVPTVLGNPPRCHFDALFHWED